MKKLLIALCLLGLLTSPALAGPCASATTLSGTFTQTGGEYYVGATRVYFGPAWYLSSTMAKADYDKDGSLETIASELSGLLGTVVTVTGCTGNGVFNVFTLNGLPYRDPSAPPPWASRQGRRGR